jgi:hypothetical protein
VTRPTQADFGLLGKGKEIFDVVEMLKLLLCRSPTGFSKGCLILIHGHWVAKDFRVHSQGWMTSPQKRT